MRKLSVLVGAVVLALAPAAWADDPSGDTSSWQRLDARYCTLWVHPGVKASQVNRQISTARVRPRVRPADGDTWEAQLAAKCDTIFRRTQEVLDMFPPGLHVTVKVVRDLGEIKSAHAARYGHGTDAVAFYIFENNTIYVSAAAVSESILAHEMAHCIIDHYFGVRPPRKIEEMLAIYVDEHLRD